MSQLCATFLTKLHVTFRLTDINTISLPIERINWNHVSVFFCFQIQMNINKNIYSTSLIRWQIVSIVTPCDISNKINQCAPHSIEIDDIVAITIENGAKWTHKSTAIKLEQQLISNMTPIHCRCHKLAHIQLIAIKSDFIWDRESWSSTWHKNKIQCIFMRLNWKLFAIEIHLTKYALVLCTQIVNRFQEKMKKKRNHSWSFAMV